MFHRTRGISRAADHHDRVLSRRRRNRHRRPADQYSARRGTGQAGDHREPRRRRRQYRHCGGGARRWRWLYLARVLERLRGQSEPLCPGDLRPFKDFVPVMVIGASPNAFVVPAQSDIKTMPELIAKAKANPGKLNWTSPGAGTTPYLAGEVLKLRTGINMLHIPFPGA